MTGVHFIRFREHHTRKTDREATTRDILNNLLVSSDPLISSLRREHAKKKNILEGAREMFVNYEQFSDENESGSDSNDESS